VSVPTDTQRLDWIEKYQGRPTQMFESQPHRIWTQIRFYDPFPPDGESIKRQCEGGDLRGAVDAGMKMTGDLS
jgi:hypothetical protein